MTRFQIIRATAYALSIHSPLPSDIPCWPIEPENIFQYTVIVKEDAAYWHLSPHFDIEEDGLIDWGDGSSEYVTGMIRSLRHHYSAPGLYQVTIYGKMTYFQAGNQPHWIYSIDSQFPKSMADVTDFRSCFMYCSELVSVPNNLFQYNKKAIDFSTCFYGCHSLTEIPSLLFADNKKAEYFSACFMSCDSLLTIPSNLFKNNEKVKTFAQCFHGCTKIQSIPSDLFRYNYSVTSFEECFAECHALRAIPSSLFSHTQNVTTFQSCFYNCRSITSIPSNLFYNTSNVTTFESCFYNCISITFISFNLFDNTLNVTTFQSCFSGCTSIISSVPQLWVTHSSAYGKFCFRSCTNATNYNDIPSSWR